MSQTETQNEPEPDVDVDVDVDQKQHHQKEEDMIIDGIDGPDNGPGTGADDDGLPNGPNESSDDDSLSLSDGGDDQQSTPPPTTIPPLHRFLDNSGMPPPQKVENVEEMLSWAAMFFEQLNKARSGPGIDVEFFFSDQ